jgi:hypothetical protein
MSETEWTIQGSIPPRSGLPSAYHTLIMAEKNVYIEIKKNYTLCLSISKLPECVGEGNVMQYLMLKNIMFSLIPVNEELFLQNCSLLH